MDNSTMTMVLYMAVFFGIMYFLMIRPQQKQAKQRSAMLNSLRAGDKVITAGGIHGKIKKVKDESVILQIADKVEIECTKTGIASVVNRDVTADDKKAKDEKETTSESPEATESKEG